MKIIFKVFLISIILFCIISCCKKLHFEKNETFWTDCYNKDDALVFKSSFANQDDTIFITNKTVFTPTGDCNVMVSNYDPEGCVIDYRYKHDTILSDSDLFIQHFKEKEGSSNPILRVYGTEFSSEKLKDTTIVLSTTRERLNDCYTFQSKLQSYNGWSYFKLKTFVWSKRKGLVVFIGQNGEKFELEKKIRRKT